MCGGVAGLTDTTSGGGVPPDPVPEVSRQTLLRAPSLCADRQTLLRAPSLCADRQTLLRAPHFVRTGRHCSGPHHCVRTGCGYSGYRGILSWLSKTRGAFTPMCCCAVRLAAKGSLPWRRVGTGSVRHCWKIDGAENCFRSRAARRSLVPVTFAFLNEFRRVRKKFPRRVDQSYKETWMYKVVSQSHSLLSRWRCCAVGC
jgi:hypothetical protein